MTEREKYQRLWMDPNYRRWSPGEDQVAKFIEVAKPEGLVVDFGCGTGRAALSMVERGLSVLLVDFTDNCRDRAAMILPFIQWDLTEPLPVAGKYGFCADVMEHIPTDVVPTVIRNIMAAGKRVFFQISTVPDQFGATIGQKLHLTVKPHDWWQDQFSRWRNYRISWQEERPGASCFFVEEV
jgi:2-polyprenyl-3-methyl-5-hydroxy-6-metoxy-1,4-benzoquinol methylase